MPTACFLLPEFSGHINPSLALAAHLTKSGWRVHYLSSNVFQAAILGSGATFDDERDAAPTLCAPKDDGERPGYFEAWERFRRANAETRDRPWWEGRAHIENQVTLEKLPGTVSWMRKKAPDVVVYCNFFCRVGQLAALVLDVAHVALWTMNGFGGVKGLIGDMIVKQGGTLAAFKDLYATSKGNQAAIEALCAPPYNLDRALFAEGSPPWVFSEPPYASTLAPSSLITTAAALRDPVRESLDEEMALYAAKGKRLHWVGPLLPDAPGAERATTHKETFNAQEKERRDADARRLHRRRSELHPAREDVVELVRNAKSVGRRVVVVSLGTVVTSDHPGVGWKAAPGHSITGKDLVQGVVDGVLDVAGLPRLSSMPSRALDDAEDVFDEGADVDDDAAPLVVCAMGQQVDALDGLSLPPNVLCRASIPQVDVLRELVASEDLFVHHGGQNSVMEALSFGLPAVVCPTFGDQVGNAEKLEALGAGLRVDRPTASGADAVGAYRRDVAAAVRTIREDPSFAAAAGKLQAELKSAGGVTEAEAILRAAIEAVAERKEVATLADSCMGMDLSAAWEKVRAYAT